MRTKKLKTRVVQCACKNDMHREPRQGILVRRCGVCYKCDNFIQRGRNEMHGRMLEEKRSVIETPRVKKENYCRCGFALCLFCAIFTYQRPALQSRRSSGLGFYSNITCLSDPDTCLTYVCVWFR